jgi:hypothetical protein
LFKVGIGIGSLIPPQEAAVSNRLHPAYAIRLSVAFGYEAIPLVNATNPTLGQIHQIEIQLHPRASCRSLAVNDLTALFQIVSSSRLEKIWLIDLSHQDEEAVRQHVGAEVKIQHASRSQVI